MVCVYCSHETRVGNSRHQKRLNRVWRRRTCIKCGTTFTTSEAVDLSGSITVKHDKRLEPFQRDKLLLSVYESLKHRKTALSDATSLTDTIISGLYPLMHSAMIENDQISQVVFAVLERFDKPAAVYYAAFHPIDSNT